ncbi:prefoldin subunit 2-like [Tubulanus polymorphus]|uniref:prefoldin subunit 2-like n=1 Tax=Tubulanus polymorphus TaxID=672921 RepID=UPI003DA678BE
MSTAAAQKQKQVNQEAIISGFNELRQQQRALASKISELEMDCKEHELVIDTLKDIKDGDRKCYRLVGGILVERTVKDVSPALVNNKEQIGMLVTNLTKQLEAKGKELNDYREKYNIRVRGEEDDVDKKHGEDKAKSTTQGVLVQQT